jgi:hypothetical protein
MYQNAPSSNLHLSKGRQYLFAVATTTHIATTASYRYLDVFARTRPDDGPSPDVECRSNLFALSDWNSLLAFTLIAKRGPS